MLRDRSPGALAAREKGSQNRAGGARIVAHAVLKIPADHVSGPSVSRRAVVRVKDLRSQKTQ